MLACRIRIIDNENNQEINSNLFVSAKVAIQNHPGVSIVYYKIKEQFISLTKEEIEEVNSHYSEKKSIEEVIKAKLIDKADKRIRVIKEFDNVICTSDIIEIHDDFKD